jgi:hypothetical protein
MEAATKTAEPATKSSPTTKSSPAEPAMAPLSRDACGSQ